MAKTPSSQCRDLDSISGLIIISDAPAKTEIQWASLVAQRAKCLPAMQETQVRSLGWEDPLEKEMAAHSSILACRIPWTLGGLQSMGLQRVRQD